MIQIILAASCGGYLALSTCMLVATLIVMTRNNRKRHGGGERR